MPHKTHIYEDLFVERRLFKAAAFSKTGNLLFVLNFRKPIKKVFKGAC